MVVTENGQNRRKVVGGMSRPSPIRGFYCAYGHGFLKVAEEFVLVCGYRLFTAAGDLVFSLPERSMGPSGLVALESTPQLVPKERGKVGRLKFLFLNYQGKKKK